MNNFRLNVTMGQDETLECFRILETLMKSVKIDAHINFIRLIKFSYTLDY